MPPKELNTSPSTSPPHLSATCRVTVSRKRSRGHLHGQTQILSHGQSPWRSPSRSQPTGQGRRAPRAARMLGSAPEDSASGTRPRLPLQPAARHAAGIPLFHLCQRQLSFLTRCPLVHLPLPGRWKAHPSPAAPTYETISSVEGAGFCEASAPGEAWDPGVLGGSHQPVNQAQRSIRKRLPFPHSV